MNIKSSYVWAPVNEHLKWFINKTCINYVHNIMINIKETDNVRCVYIYSTTYRYRIRRNFRGMKFLLNRKQTEFLLLYFCGSQVHRGKVACYVLLQISNCCKLANFHGLKFRSISRWPRNPRSLHIVEISAHTVPAFQIKFII